LGALRGSGSDQLEAGTVNFRNAHARKVKIVPDACASVQGTIGLGEPGRERVCIKVST